MKLDYFLNLNKKITVVCVSKYYTHDKIKEAYNLGFKNFGESKLQDLEKKHELLKDLDISWHFIGRLQSNKIKKIVLYSDLIHSVSNLKHLKKINLEASNINKIQRVLLQVNLTQEENKDGFSLEEFKSIINDLNYENLSVEGIMIIGPHTENKKAIDDVFKRGNEIFRKYNLKILSMGMSFDYDIALENNSNCLRIGKRIFNLID